MLLIDEMGLKMENFDMWVHWKIQFLVGGVVVTKEKTIYRVELPKAGGLGQCADFREGA